MPGCIDAQRAVYYILKSAPLPGHRHECPQASKCEEGSEVLIRRIVSRAPTFVVPYQNSIPNFDTENLQPGPRLTSYRIKIQYPGSGLVQWRVASSSPQARCPLPIP